MNFANPTFLFGLFALLIPIIIHLFNFRRYKTVYFSNVKMLQDIMQKTRRESQIQHLIVLLLRMIAIAAIVMAFAQPYLSDNKENGSKNSGHLVTLFVDNSFSMNANSEEGPLIQNAIDNAKSIVNSFAFSDEFILITQDFNSKHSHIMNREEVISMLDEIEISPNHKSISEMMTMRDNIARNAHNHQAVNYIISDFQKSGFQWEGKNNEAKNFLIPLTAAEVNNVAIDSCWFSAPVFKKGQEITLNVRIHNYGTDYIMKLPIKLYVNNTQQALAAVDIKANSYSDYQMKYTLHEEGIQCGMLEINDAPITFDDKFYFVYEVTANTQIITIQENNSNKYLKAMFGYDSLFVYTEMNHRQINYSQFKECQLVILDQLTEISTGLANELKNFVEAGGSLLIFPHKEANLKNYQTVLSNIGGNHYTQLISNEMKVGSINYESIYFKDAIQKQNEKMDMPIVTNHFEIASGADASAEVIMRLEDNTPLLTSVPIGKGNLFLSAVALDDYFGNAHRNALFFIPLHNIGIKSQMQGTLYNIIGKSTEQTIARKSNSSDDVFTMKAQKGNIEFIPGQKSIGNETRIFFHSQVTQSGLYDLLQGKINLTTLAFNFNNEESDLTYYSKKDLEEMFADNEGITLLDGNSKNIAKKVAEQLNGHPLWRLFIIIALIALLGEILVLRFWGSPSKDNK
ncbi:MAG: BatA domain-containing protein [Bacteroidales bacterium]|nr:BatA domain-containing protein [Bacteroidales bacterium]